MDNPVISEDYVDLIIGNEALDLYSDGSNVTFINNAYSMIHVPRQDINECSIGEYPYYVFPTCSTLESIISLEESGVTRTRINPNFGMLGSGVLVGVIDTGIEYQHQAFLNANNTSKIVSIWDQTINDGESPPENFTYGTEYSQDMLNAALDNEDPLSIVPTTDEIGHGTMLAGVIAGNVNLAEDFSGIAPNSELIVVKLKQAKQGNRAMFLLPPDAICYQSTDILLAIRYILTTAIQLNRPLALCIAIGTSQGGHDGRGPLDNYLGIVANLPRIGVAIAAGNEGNTRRHYLGQIEARQEFKEFEVRVSNRDRMFAMEVWQSPPHRLAIDFISPTGEYIPRIYPRIGECRQFSFIFEPSIIWVNNNIIEGEVGDQLILVRFLNAQEGIWRFRVYNLESVASQFHAWLPSGDLISDETYFLESNPDITITSPGNSVSPITITSYNPASGGILISASRGYTRADFIKPDLAAPGVNIACPTLNNSYGRASGTGVAAAHTTGIIAMVLEWAVVRGNFRFVRGTDIKTLLIRGAKRDIEVIYPNNIWGYGKIDLYGLFQMLT